MCMALGVARAELVGIVAVSGHQLNLHKALSGASLFPRGEGMTSGAHQSENKHNRYAVRGSGATAVTTALLMILPERLFGLPQCAVTATGRARLAVVPSPSWPLLLPPQPHTVPSDASAIECSLPAAIATSLLRNSTRTGALRLTVVPSPN